MKILCTGASGLIGSHTYKKFKDEGHDVVGTDVVEGDGIFQLDLLDKEKTAEYIAEFRPEVIYHFAANAAEGKSHFSPIDITKRNIEIFLNVIVPGINNGMRRFVFPSSVAVYGSIDSPFRERSLPVPKDIYGINKLAIEQMIDVLSKVHGFEYAIARLHNVYGPNQNMKDAYRNVVTIFMNHLLQEKAYSIYGDGSMARCFSYIDDVVDVLYKLSSDDVNGLVVNVGSDKLTSLQELSDVIQEVSGVHIEPKYIGDRAQEVKKTVPDHVLCKTMFGYNETPIAEGLKKAWDWCKDQGPQKIEYGTFEIDSKRIPSNWKK